MFLDRKYTNNIVFQQEAVQELLDNIRDYPIIDIDYIEQNERDAKSATATIWDYYTDGTPCIKITYGDKTTTKGNVIFAKIFQKAKILAENKKADLINGNIEASDLAKKWEKIYNENLDLYTNRLAFLRSENDYFSAEALLDAKTIINKLYALIDEYNVRFEDWYEAGLAKDYEVLINGVRTTRFEERTLITLQNDSSSSPLKADYVLCSAANKSDIISQLLGLESTIIANNVSTTVIIDGVSFDVIDAYDELIELIKNYPNYEALQGLAVPNPNDPIDLTQAANQTPNQIYTYLNNLVNTIVNAAKTKMDNSLIVWQYYQNQIANINTQITNLNAVLAGCDQCIEQIALGNREPNLTSQNLAGVKSENIAVNNHWADLAASGDRTITLESETTAVSGGTDRLLEGVKYVKVGSNIKFYDPSTNNYLTSIDSSTTQNNGTFRVTINSDTYQVPIKGLEESDTNDLKTSTNLLPNVNNSYNLGSSSAAWANAYINNLYPTTGNTTSSVGDLNNPYAHGYFSEIKIGDVTIGGTNGDAGKFLRGDGAWSDAIVGSLKFNTSTANNATTNVKISNNDNNGTISSGSGTSLTYSINTAAAIYTKGGIAAEKNIWAAKVFNAVFNDYAECRKSTMVSAGYVVIDQDNGTMIPSSERLQPGAQIVSDTYGHLMGMTEGAKTPIAVAGRVLAYTYQPRENYHAGMAVCSAPGGTIDIMSREEIRDYPDCIIGIVSEIPDYDIWGSDNIKVNGRIWIKVR